MVVDSTIIHTHRQTEPYERNAAADRSIAGRSKPERLLLKALGGESLGGGPSAMQLASASPEQAAEARINCATVAKEAETAVSDP